MNIQEVLREMREEFADDAPVMRWADAIEAAMRERDAKIERLQARIDGLMFAHIEDALAEKEETKGLTF